jgi:hypothetical protein
MSAGESQPVRLCGPFGNYVVAERTGSAVVAMAFLFQQSGEFCVQLITELGVA